MPKFMLLLHDPPKAFAGLSPDEMQKIVQKYIAWGRALKAKRLLAASHKLSADAGRIMRRQRGRTLVSDGPYAESKELLASGRSRARCCVTSVRWRSDWSARSGASVRVACPSRCRRDARWPRASSPRWT